MVTEEFGVCFISTAKFALNGAEEEERTLDLAPVFPTPSRWSQVCTLPLLATTPPHCYAVPDIALKKGQWPEHGTCHAGARAASELGPSQEYELSLINTLLHAEIAMITHLRNSHSTVSYQFLCPLACSRVSFLSGFSKIVSRSSVPTSQWKPFYSQYYLALSPPRVEFEASSIQTIRDIVNETPVGGALLRSHRD
ncbi:hypothetical protein B0H10DRAFT_2185711 [Mycena sp. CBHHK59/15]|nr:hypothetical protein B0H10DRAFT_2185711 [Mycena sp. CBHHK59/15]